MIGMSLNGRARIVVLCGALVVALAAAPGAAPSTQPPVCCFLVSVDVKGSITSTWTRHGDAYVMAGGRDYEGDHSASWTWSSREFIEIVAAGGDAHAYTQAVGPPGSSPYTQRFVPGVLRATWTEHAEFASWFCAVLRCKDKKINRQDYGVCERSLETPGYIRADTDRHRPLGNYGVVPGLGRFFQVDVSDDPVGKTYAACGELTGGVSRHGYGHCPLRAPGDLEAARPDGKGPWNYALRAPSVLTLVAQFKRGFSKTFTYAYNHGPSTGPPLPADHTTTGSSTVTLRASYFPRGSLAAHIKTFQKEFPVHKSGAGQKLWNDDRPCGHKGP
jgi:hypothetical protein